MNDLIIKIDNLFRPLNKKYVYCGSISLYLNGMNIDHFNDIDVDFIGCTENEKVFIWIENEPLPIDKVVPIEGIPIEYKEIEFEGRKLKGPNNSDEMLKIVYGDYKSLPSYNKRNSHYSKVIFK